MGRYKHSINPLAGGFWKKDQFDYTRAAVEISFGVANKSKMTVIKPLKELYVENAAERKVLLDYIRKIYEDQKSDWFLSSGHKQWRENVFNEFVDGLLEQ